MRPGRSSRRWSTRLAWVTVAVGGAVLALGTVVTGSGPHSGDADEPNRFGFDPRTVSWLHADLVMIFIGLVVATWLAARLTAVDDERGPARAWLVVLAVALGAGADRLRAVLHRPARGARHRPHARGQPARGRR